MQEIESVVKKLTDKYNVEIFVKYECSLKLEFVVTYPLARVIRVFPIMLDEYVLLPYEDLSQRLEFKIVDAWRQMLNKVGDAS